MSYEGFPKPNYRGMPEGWHLHFSLQTAVDTLQMLHDWQHSEGGRVLKIEEQPWFGQTHVMALRIVCAHYGAEDPLEFP